MNAQPTFTPAQQFERRNFIGGSEAAAAVNLNPWRSQFDLWQEKCGIIPPFTGNEATKWGLLHEPIIRQEYAERTGRTVRLPSETLHHGIYTFMGCHPDGVTEDRRLFEAKTARYGDDFGEEGSDNIPEQYLIQCQHNMFVMDLAVADLAVLIGGSQLRLYEIPADKELQEFLVHAEAQFMDCVANARAPEPDLTRPDAIAVLKKMYPGTSGEILVADETSILTRTKLQAAQEQEKAAKTAADGYKAHLLATMGEATFLNFPDGKTYRRAIIDKKEYTVKAQHYVEGRFIKTP